MPDKQSAKARERGTACDHFLSEGSNPDVNLLIEAHRAKPMNPPELGVHSIPQSNLESNAQAGVARLAGNALHITPDNASGHNAPTCPQPCPRFVGRTCSLQSGAMLFLQTG
jgi:hypothetical protein